MHNFSTFRLSKDEINDLCDVLRYNIYRSDYWSDDRILRFRKLHGKLIVKSVFMTSDVDIVLKDKL